MISLEEYKKRIKIANVALTAGGIFFILFGLYMVATVFSIQHLLSILG